MVRGPKREVGGAAGDAVHSDAVKRRKVAVGDEAFPQGAAEC